MKNNFYLFPREKNNGPSSTSYILFAESMVMMDLRHPKKVERVDNNLTVFHGTPYFHTECRNFILIGGSYCRAFWKTPGGGYTPKEIHKRRSEYFNCCTCGNWLRMTGSINIKQLKHVNIDSAEAGKALWMYFLGRRGWNKTDFFLSNYR